MSGENYTKALIKTHKTVKVERRLSELPRPSAPVKKQKVPRPHPMKGKMKKHTSGAQRLKALKLHREDPKSNYAPPYAISRWKKQEADLLKRPMKELQSKNYFLKKENDVRLTGVFLNNKWRLFVNSKSAEDKESQCQRNGSVILCFLHVSRIDLQSLSLQRNHDLAHNGSAIIRTDTISVYVVERTKRKLAFLNDCIRLMVSMLTANMIWLSMKFPQNRKSHLPQKINHSHSMNLLRIWLNF